MANNKRKVYGYGDGDAADGNGAQPCPVCGCRHRDIVRAVADRSRVLAISICRNCGHQTIETA